MTIALVAALMLADYKRKVRKRKVREESKGHGARLSLGKGDVMT